MIKQILWDFDGVILNSNKVRDLGFERVLMHYPEKHVQELLIFHRKNGGLSRYVKFRYFFSEIIKKCFSEDEIMQLSVNFSEIMRVLLVNRNLLISDTINFIKKYHKNYQMHIVSGSDENELQFLCEKLDIIDYFISIQGSPTPKTKLIKNLLKAYKCSKEEACLIGDSKNDLDAARSNEITFYGYNNLELELEGKYLHDMSMLTEEIK